MPRALSTAVVRVFELEKGSRKNIVGELNKSFTRVLADRPCFALILRGGVSK